MSPRLPRALPRRWFLMLEGVPCGFLASFSGGGPTADPLPDAGSTGFVRKHLGPLRYEPITISFGLFMAPSLYAWIADAWNGKPERKKGSIVALGVGGKAVTALDFEDAFIVKTRLPGLDAAAKSAAAIGLTIQPRLTRPGKASAPAQAPAGKQKQWLASNYMLQIEGLDCSRVSKIEPLVVAGTSPVDFPAPSVTLAASTQKPWADWLEEFVVKGLNDDAHEKSGSIVYLAPNEKDQLGTVKLSNLGIFRLSPESAERRQETIPRVVAELYCERIELEL
jgi:hypothetical protein